MASTSKARRGAYLDIPQNSSDLLRFKPHIILRCSGIMNLVLMMHYMAHNNHIRSYMLGVIMHYKAPKARSPANSIPHAAKLPKTNAE